MTRTIVGLWKLDLQQCGIQRLLGDRRLWQISKHTIAVYTDRGKRVFEYFIDTKLHPSKIDTTMPIFAEGVFEIHEDELKIAFASTGQGRPRTIEEFKVGSATLLTFSRVDMPPDVEDVDFHTSVFGLKPQRRKRTRFDRRAERVIMTMYAEADAKAIPTANERVLIDVVWMLVQVNAGGFEKYLRESGDQAKRTVTALAKIGATETAKILTDAIETLTPLESSVGVTENWIDLLDRATIAQLEQIRSHEERFFSRRDDLYVLLETSIRAAQDQD